MKYFVVQTIWHEGEKRHAYPGERVDLGHLSEGQLAKLMEANVILSEAEGASRFSKSLGAFTPTPPPAVAEAAAKKSAAKE